MIANHSQPCPARDQNLPGSPPSYFYPAKGRGEGRAWLQGTTDCGFSLLYIPYGSKFSGSKTFAIFVTRSRKLNSQKLQLHEYDQCDTVARMSLYNYFKPASVLPSPDGPLSKIVPSSSIQAANEAVQATYYLMALLQLDQSPVKIARREELT